MKMNLILPKAHPRQKEILKSKARFRVVACGRRFGKTTLGERAILIRASEKNQACWWLSPTYDMADHVWRDLKAAVRDDPEVQISESNLRMDFSGGGWLEIHSAHNPDHLRGAGLDFVVLDEAAYMFPDIWPEIVRPMLLERKGRALFLSTPWGRNWFYHLYLLGQQTPIPVADANNGSSPLLAQRGGVRGGDFR
jgi:Terminase large subunit, T4likevirus-type, N-terminal